MTAKTLSRLHALGVGAITAGLGYLSIALGALVSGQPSTVPAWRPLVIGFGAAVGSKVLGIILGWVNEDNTPGAT